MTTIITRVFPNSASAHGAADRLQAKGVPDRHRDVIVDGEHARFLLERAEVHESAIEPYLKRLKAGNAVLAVRTTYKPLEAARITRAILARYDTIPVANVVDDFFVPDKPDPSPSVLKDHPLMLSLPRSSRSSGPITPGLGMPLIKERKGGRPLTSHDKRMSRGFWPMPLTTRKTTSSAMRGGGHMSRMFWPMPLLSTKHRRKSVISGGGYPFSRLFGLRTTT